MIAPKGSDVEDDKTAVLHEPDPRAVNDGGLAFGAVMRGLFGQTADLTRLARYEARGLLGAGGFGSVIEARDPELRRSVAIKLVRATDSADADVLLDEARVLAKLSHPNVVAVHDVGRYALSPEQRVGVLAESPPEGVFVVMELVDGPTLREWLESARGWRETVDMLVQAGRGLEAAHQRGIVHRDFKPSNVLIGVDGRARISDFGLAGPSGGATGDEVGSRGSGSSSSTARFVGGTPPYMAPEVAAGAVAAERADQFSFCVALYEALAGQRPFVGSPRKMAAAKATGDYNPLPPSTPGWLRAAVTKGLCADPGARFETMSKLLEVLDWRRRRRRRGAVTLATLGLTFSALTFSIGDQQRAHRRCADLDASLSRMWNEERRESVRAVVERSAGDDPESRSRSWERVSTPIEERIETLATERGKLCRAQAATGQGAGAADECFAHRQDELDALIGHIARVPEVDTDEAVVAIKTLRFFEWCADPKRRKAFAQPAAPSAREALAAQRMQLAAAYEAKRMHQFESAETTIERVIAWSREAGGEALLAEALMLRLRIEYERGDERAARATADEALRAALRTDAQAFALSAHAYRMHTATELKLMDAIVADAAGVLEGTGLAGTELEMNWLEANASAAYRNGRYQEALDAMTRHREIGTSLFGPSSEYVATAEGNRAVYLRHLGRLDEAGEVYRRGLAYFGPGKPEDPQHIAMLMNYASLLRAMNRVEEPRVLLDLALGAARSLGGDVTRPVGNGYIHRCALERDAHNLAAAREACERGLAVRKRLADSAASRDVLRARVLLVEVATLQGDSATALAQAEGVVEELERTAASGDTLLLRARRHRGLARAIAGDFDGALTDLEAALGAAPKGAERERAALARAEVLLLSGAVDDALSAVRTLRRQPDAFADAESGEKLAAHVEGIEGEALRRAGDPEHARELLENALSLDTGERTFRWQQRARANLALLLTETNADPDQGSSQLQQLHDELVREAPSAPLTRDVEVWSMRESKPASADPRGR